MALAPQLPPNLLREALTAARGVTDEDRWAQVLMALAPQLPPDLLDEALAGAHRIANWTLRAQVLAALTRQLPPDRQGRVEAEALADARRITDVDRRAQALAALTRQLSADLLGEALSGACRITTGSRRTEVLAALAEPMADLPPLRARALLQEVLPVLARHPRHQFLTDLRALLTQRLGTVNGAQVASMTAEAVIDVGNWWP